MEIIIVGTSKLNNGNHMQARYRTDYADEFYMPGTVVGKALESYNSVSEGVIEILVGRR